MAINSQKVGPTPAPPWPGSSLVEFLSTPLRPLCAPLASQDGGGLAAPSGNPAAGKKVRQIV